MGCGENRHVAALLLSVEVLDGVAQRCTRHRGGVSVEEGPQPREVAFAGFADPAAHGLLHQLDRVVNEDLGEGECVVELAAPDEEPRGDYRCPPLPPVARPGQVVQRIAGPVGQVATDNVWGGAIDQVPGVDPIMTTQVELVQVATTVGKGAATAEPASPSPRPRRPGRRAQAVRAAPRSPSATSRSAPWPTRRSPASASHQTRHLAVARVARGIQPRCTSQPYRTTPAAADGRPRARGAARPREKPGFGQRRC